MDKKDDTQNSPDEQVIDLASEKAKIIGSRAHAEKEQRIAEMKKQFKRALPLDKLSSKGRKSKKRKNKKK